MSEQQYRVIADRSTDDVYGVKREPFDRVTYGPLGHDIVRIERPVPNADEGTVEPRTYESGWNDGRTVGFDDGWGAGAKATRDGLPSPHPPTREQVAMTIARAVDGMTDAVWRTASADYRGEMLDGADAVRVLFGNGRVTPLFPTYPAREQIAEQIDRIWRERSESDELSLDMADAVLALLSQPTPSEVEVEVEGSFFPVAELPDILARQMRALDDANRREKQHWLDQHEQPLTAEQRRERICPCTIEPVLPPAAPPSIADMVPGTTFTAELTRYPGRPLRFAREHGPYVIVDGFNYLAAEIDSSTIRDATPPESPNAN